MMLPARTASPPNFFTPRRFDSLSRPLRDEPPAFLCAMTDYFSWDSVVLAAPLAAVAFLVDAFAGAASAVGAASAAGVSALAAFAGFAFWSPIEMIRRIVCCWRWPRLRR